MKATIQTYTGLLFDLNNPQAAQVNLPDIAHSLAMQCRFGGHSLSYYSVAQHSVIVSQLVPTGYVLAALLHDAAEAYVSDVVRPLKDRCPEINYIERQVQHAVAERFGLSVAHFHSTAVCQADLQALATERRDLMTGDTARWPCLDRVQPAPETIKPLDPEQAERVFTARFKELTT